MSKQPDFNVYNVTKQKDKDDFWRKLGGAFIFYTADGRQGINFPNMQIVLLPPKADEEISE